MYCPSCGKDQCKTVDSRMYPFGVNKRIRRYKCLMCGYRFKTMETLFEGSIWSENNDEGN